MLIECHHYNILRQRYRSYRCKKFLTFLFLNKKRVFNVFTFPHVIINKKRWPTISEFPAITICYYNKHVSYKFEQNNGWGNTYLYTICLVSLFILVAKSTILITCFLVNVHGTILWTWRLTFLSQRLQHFLNFCHVFTFLTIFMLISTFYYSTSMIPYRHNS